MKLFLQKNSKIFERWGPPTPGPRASGGWGLCPQTPIGLRRLRAPPPDPPKNPTLQISVYAPVRHKCTNKDLKLGLQSLVKKQANYSY